MNSYEYALVDVSYNIRPASFQTDSERDYSWSSSSGTEFVNIAVNKNQKTTVLSQHWGRVQIRTHYHNGL